jgi:hypothetical protein
MGRDLRIRIRVYLGVYEWRKWSGGMEWGKWSVWVRVSRQVGSVAFTF